MHIYNPTRQSDGRQKECKCIDFSFNFYPAAVYS